MKPKPILCGVFDHKWVAFMPTPRNGYNVCARCGVKESDVTTPEAERGSK